MDKIILIKDGEVVKKIEGKLLNITERAGILDITTEFDSHRRTICSN